MTDLNGAETEHHGEFGDAARLTLPDIPSAAETVAVWLLTAPGQSPAWTQYLLLCVRLRDNIPGFPDPVRKFDGATHEIDLMALDPASIYTADSLSETLDAGLSIIPLTLRPLNFVEQFEGTDDEMTLLLSWCAWGVTVGALPAEPATRDIGQRQWLSSIVKTLAHFHGEDHAL